MKFPDFFLTCGNHEITCRVILTLEVFRRRPIAWTKRKDTQLDPVPVVGGEGYSTNIWVEVNAEGLKPWPCFGTKASIWLPCLGQRKCTSFRTDLRKIIYPVSDKEDENHTMSSGTSSYRPYKVVPTQPPPPPPGCGRNNHCGSSTTPRTDTTYTLVPLCPKAVLWEMLVALQASHELFLPGQVPHQSLHRFAAVGPEESRYVYPCRVLLPPDGI